jgi:hypothetical protein
VPQLEQLTELRRAVEVEKMRNVRLEEATRAQGAALDASLAELEKLRGELAAIQAELLALRAEPAAN